MQLIRSLIFTAYMMLSALLFGAFMSLCFWAPYRVHFAIARSWARISVLDAGQDLRTHSTWWKAGSAFRKAITS